METNEITWQEAFYGDDEEEMESDLPDNPEEKRVYTPENVLMVVWICGIIIALASIILSYIFLSRTAIEWLFPDYSQYMVPSTILIIWAYIYRHM